MLQFDLEFWDREAGELYNSTASVVLAVFQAGGMLGQAMLPGGLQQLISWDVFSQAAIDYLKLFRLDQVTGITATTRKGCIAVIEDWIESGAPLHVLENRLSMPSLLGASRAESIAVTEVTRAYAMGNISAWQSTGFIEHKVWATAEDELVCPYCGRLAGRVVGLGDYFRIGGDELPPTKSGYQQDYIYFAPPAHPRCRCWLKPIVSEAAFERNLDKVLAA